MSSKFAVFLVLAILIVGFWLKPELQELAAGVAIFLFAMRMLEDGFRLFSGGALERTLGRATSSVPRALAFGTITTTLMQSSSLVTLITISFLSAGMITLKAGIAIIFGANIGTTTGAWLVAGFGLKVNIATFAMPMIAISVVLALQSNRTMRGAGYVLAGVGFLFLGIHYMKEGFDALSGDMDLARYAMTGVAGLIVYTLIGAGLTVVLQSSHATMVLIITALAAGQISYENALALAIGSNIGTTVTSVIGAMSSNYQGRRLAAAHLIFNMTTAVVALVFIKPMVASVDTVSDLVNIPPDDYALRLAVFHSLFNLLGVGLMLPLLDRLVAFLEHLIPEPAVDISQPRYLSDASDDFPGSFTNALALETRHLLDNALPLISATLGLDWERLHTARSIEPAVSTSRGWEEIDFESAYAHHIKPLHAAILEFSSGGGMLDLPKREQEEIYAIRDGASRIVRAVKAVSQMQSNTRKFANSYQGDATDLYDSLRAEVARVLLELDAFSKADPDTRSNLWLDQERLQIEWDSRTSVETTDRMIREGAIGPNIASSFLNDSRFAYRAMRDLTRAAQACYHDRDPAMAEVEKILQVEEFGPGGSENRDDAA